MALHLYRVVVRGVFDDPDAAATTRLRDALADHDIFDSAFTEAGTLTYDHHLHAFNTRFALRLDGEAADTRLEAELVALDGTAALLAELGVTGKDHRVTVTDMADMWGSADRRDRLREGRNRGA